MMNVSNAKLFDIDVRIDADGVVHLAPDVTDWIKANKDTEFSLAGVKFDRVDYGNDVLSLGEVTMEEEVNNV